MIRNRNNDRKVTLNFFRGAVCAFGLWVALAAAPAFSQDVHQLLYNNSGWADQNLNSPANGASVAAFLTTPNDQEHVYYVASTSHVHQIFYNGTSWGDEDLTTLSGGPTAGYSVAGFSVGNFQYVYYVTAFAPYHVHQLLYNNASWVDSDLTALSGATKQANNNYRIVAFTTSPALHVYYQEYATNNIHQLYSTDTTTWQDQNLTTLTGAAQPSYLWAGFNIGNLQYLYYQDLNLDIHQLYYNNVGWSDIDLSATTTAPRAVGFTGTAFVIPGSKKIRLYYVNQANSHLTQLATSNDKSWTSTDLTKKSKGPLPQGSDSLLAFATTPNDEIHVFYESGNHINQLYQPTSSTWANQDLTAATSASAAVSYTRLAGFSLQNYQYVFYVAQ